MIEIQAFLCEHCAKGKRNRGTTYRKKLAATKHEAICFYNPVNHACITCGGFTRAVPPSDPDDCWEPSACHVGHDLDTQTNSQGEQIGGLRSHCSDWIPEQPAQANA